ncbi:MAG TPA: lmo0937 family membrane protein [Chitinophagaceae bacterium]|nr:lmo0937 family membrane protein [Chitinophagaceae bacterium]
MAFILQKEPKQTMLYLIAIILLIGWVLGFFVFSAGQIIHILLVLAVIAILLRLIRGDNPV